MISMITIFSFSAVLQMCCFYFESTFETSNINATVDIQCDILPRLYPQQMQLAPV